jgi:hypothetical protein
MTTNTVQLHRHHLRRILAVAAGTLALMGAAGSVVQTSADASPAPSPARAAEATTAWLANNR